MEALAGKLRSRVGVGKVDCNEHFNLCYQAKLNAYPTLYYYAGATSGIQVGLHIDSVINFKTRLKIASFISTLPTHGLVMEARRSLAI